MSEWPANSSMPQSALAIEQVAARLVVAALYGVCVAAVFRFSHGRDKADVRVLASTLVLLSVLIAMVSMVIGDSVARAFSLVGALSIVRFRTVVEDTRDTAFVIFSVVVGMAAGAGLIWTPLVGIPLVALVAIGLSRFPSSGLAVQSQPYTLVLRLGLGRDPSEICSTPFERYLARRRITAVETGKQGASITVTYRAEARPGADLVAFVAELNQVQGVQGVEIQT
ncbi:DUF4956 domain-containing protein [Lacipirellula parvula]|uniref:DUF4956 domain-containing protein n=1 Tax=Lacipirellula parvula TaxID=2650471 RepID=A0A5K7X9N5_9BACT|nr:DUF4956 domain-containing protein [Lacipirellula parvula]BBO33444.1 hypothetical protein PLANPX_3056 [Lacipirellula parvula]